MMAAFQTTIHLLETPMCGRKYLHLETAIHKASPSIQERAVSLKMNTARRGDEINLLQGGRNYGWPVITYGRAARICGVLTWTACASFMKNYGELLRIEPD
jgi:hypothetical protein